MPGTGLLLAPYNDSMSLGQGFNSYLLAPCVKGATAVTEAELVELVEGANADPTGPSQIVSYSARFVEKISDVVRTMNISAASSIKGGSIEIPGNAISLDETKFLSSDLNVVVSVKVPPLSIAIVLEIPSSSVTQSRGKTQVINQSIRVVDEAVFNPMKDVQVDNDNFPDIYGDCYISGFMEGGELHGIVSVKVLDASNTKEVEQVIKGHMSGIGGTSELTHSEGSGGSQLSSILSKTETTISVSWSGGGQIKSESEEWSLDTLFRTAAAFPARVASCPQCTWAILTKYNSNRGFVRWADKNKITIPQYQNVQAYTYDLLDMYMGYKNNIARLQAVLRNPEDYVISSVPKAIPTTVAVLVDEQKQIKGQMGLIVKEIDTLCIHPEKIEEVEGNSQIKSPEAWATRLPVPVPNITNDRAKQILREPPKTPSGAEKGSMPTVEPEAVLGPPPTYLVDLIKKTTSEVLGSMGIHPLCTPAVEAMMRPHERTFVTSRENMFKFRSYRFDMPCGTATGHHFNDAADLQIAIIPVTWPTRIEINLDQGWEDWKYPIVGWYKVCYGEVTLERGDKRTPIQTLSMELSPGEFITKVKLAAGSYIGKWGVSGLRYVEVETSQGRVKSVGDAHGQQIIEETPPTGFLGLKGFYGGYGAVVDRMGAIWGRDYP